MEAIKPVGRPATWTKEQRADILQKRLSGLSCADIAKEYNCHRQYIQHILTQEGYQFDPRPAPKGGTDPWNTRRQPLEINGYYNPDFNPYIFQ